MATFLAAKHQLMNNCSTNDKHAYTFHFFIFLCARNGKAGLLRGSSDNVVALDTALNAFE
jgi:hypothetical protein